MAESGQRQIRSVLPGELKIVNDGDNRKNQQKKGNPGKQYKWSEQVTQ